MPMVEPPVFVHRTWSPSLTTPHGATAPVMNTLLAFAPVMSARPIELVDGLPHQICTSSTAMPHGCTDAPRLTKAAMMFVPLTSARAIVPQPLETPHA